MKLFSNVPDLPELRDLEAGERAQVIRQWIRAVDEPWSRYLCHVGFVVLVSVPISLLPTLLFRAFGTMRSPDWLSAAALPVGVILGTVLYNRFVLPRHRDVLIRVLQQRARAL